jgi:signal transduction histidine kinase
MLYKTPEKAAQILNKARPLVEKMENSYYTQMFTLNTGIVSELKYDYNNALTMYKKALQLTRQNKDPFQECVVTNQLASCLSKMHDNKSEKTMLDSLLDKSSVYGLKYFKNEAYKKLAAWHRASGQFRLSDQFMQKIFLLNDTIASEKIITEITSIEGKFKLEQKDAEIEQLKKISTLQALSIKQKKWLNYFLSGSALILSAIILLVFLIYKQKQKLQQQQINKLTLEQKLTTSEAIIKGEEKERTRIAKDLHDGLSGMLSGVKYSLQNMQGNLIMTPDNQQSFERSMDMLDNSIKEMRRVAQNMMPEALVQFGLDVALKDFALEINRTGIIKTAYQSMGLEEKKIDQSRAVTIYRIIQELVNNVIKHASAQQVFIQLLLQENKLIVNVDDNGIGFDKKMLQSSPGMGWKNILTRVEYLKGKIDVKAEPGKGTAVNIELNLEA